MFEATILQASAHRVASTFLRHRNHRDLFDWKSRTRSAYPITINHTARILPRELVTGCIGWIAACGAAAHYFLYGLAKLRRYMESAEAPSSLISVDLFRINFFPQPR